MGSDKILKLGYRKGFSFIGTAGTDDGLEQSSLNLTDGASVTKMFQIYHSRLHNIDRDTRVWNYPPNIPRDNVKAREDAGFVLKDYPHAPAYKAQKEKDLAELYAREPP